MLGGPACKHVLPCRDHSPTNQPLPITSAWHFFSTFLILQRAPKPFAGHISPLAHAASPYVLSYRECYASETWRAGYQPHNFCTIVFTLPRTRGWYQLSGPNWNFPETDGKPLLGNRGKPCCHHGRLKALIPSVIGHVATGKDPWSMHGSVRGIASTTPTWSITISGDHR